MFLSLTDKILLYNKYGQFCKGWCRVSVGSAEPDALMFLSLSSHYTIRGFSKCFANVTMWHTLICDGLGDRCIWQSLDHHKQVWKCGKVAHFWLRCVQVSQV